MKIDFRVQEKINGLEYELEVYSNDGEHFRVCENKSRYSEFETREDFYNHFEDAAKWIFGT